MTTPASPYPPTPPIRIPKNGMGTASLTLGIIGVLLAWIPFVGFLGFLLGILAMVLGGIGIFKAHKGTATNTVVSYVGTGLGLVAFVLSLIVFGGVVSSIDQEMQGSSTELGASPAPAGGAESAAGPVNLAFGQAHTWPGGESITVSQPQEQAAENPYLAAEGRLAAVDVTVRNNGDDELQVSSVTLTAQHDGRVAQQDFLSGDPLPNVQLPPGGETTFTAVYEVGADPGELQISVQPNYFAEDTVYFKGQF